jgi:cell division protein FtsI/penicillin-binding protein 2
MTQVLEKSDNVAMVSVANLLGNQKMFDYLQSFGLGTVTGIDLKNEVAGRVLPVQQWRNINRATMSFGQGISVTPIQIATAYSAIANNGKMVRPRVVKAVISANGDREEVPTFEGAQVIRPEIAKEMRDMLVSVVVHDHKKAGVDGYKVGGKTGTAQVPDPVNGGYIENAYNHSFIGLGPSDDPKFVLLVKVDQPNIAKTGQFAEGTAVPLFGRIAKFLLHYYQIKPTNK